MGIPGQVEKRNAFVQIGFVGVLVPLDISRWQRFCSSRHWFDIFSKKAVSTTDKCQGNPATCRRKYVREEALEAQFTELLGRLKFDDEVLEWMRDALHASHADERSEHEEAIRRWCQSSYGSAFRACSTAASPARLSAAGTTSPFRA
ncbi:hypothetical protein [Mesorhizobium wenxiniae]|uniref:hypothetical protein n=1 Tax=Mesorhizobium wenxiniae TaxID=2014805 RepID=UPI0013FD1062|nr:hypothetical protein [Mesorhizobium wenxiniae]